MTDENAPPPTGPTPGRLGRAAGGVRARVAPLTSAPWVKAPLLLFRFPGILLAMGSAVLILAAASASGPLFLSSAGNRTLTDTVASFCPWNMGLQLTVSVPLAGRVDTFSDQAFIRSNAIEAYRANDAQTREQVRGIPRIGQADLQILGSSLGVERGDATLRSAKLFARDDAIAHLPRLTPTGGAGVWIPDTAAKTLRARPGDLIVLSGPVRQTKVRVAGLYRDFAFVPRDDYWCGQENLLYAPAFANFSLPPLFMADRATIVDLEHRLGERGSIMTWDFPLQAGGMTVTEAQSVSGQLQLTMTHLRDNFRFGSFPKMDSRLPFATDLSVATRASLEAPVSTISLAGRLVALVVIGASGIYWVHRRRVEVALLASKGTSPGGLGAKVLLEAIPVTAAGAALGWLAAVWLVRLLGPSTLFDASAPSSALRQVEWTTVLALAVLALVAAVAARQETEVTVSRARHVASRAPWEIPILALAAASLYEITSRRPPLVTDIRVPSKVDVLILLFPILFVAGTAGLAGRLIRAFLPRLRSAGRRWSPPLYLGTRRLASAPQIAMALLTVTALAIGILTYAGTLATSQTATSNAKAELFVGSDVSVNLAAVPLPATLPFPTTEVTRVDSGTLLAAPPGTGSVELLGVDPDTFDGTAFWDPSFGPKPLAETLAALRRGASADRVAVAVAGQGVPDEGTVALGAGRDHLLPFRVVERVAAFPGQRSGTPLIVADGSALESHDIPGFSQLWAKGDAPQILRVLTSTGSIILGTEAVADETRGLPQFRSVGWTLGFLQALGIMTGLIALGAILLYLEARQRAREVSYALARRMGLRRRAHRTSVVLELGAMLGAGVILGATLAWVAARIVYRKLDPLPTLPPPPLFRSPFLLIGITALVAVAAAWVGAWRVQRTAERANVTEVMRLAG